MDSKKNAETVWAVQLPDGTLYEAPDAHPGRAASFIYSRQVAEMVATQVGGEVVELDV